MREFTQEPSELDWIRIVPADGWYELNIYGAHPSWDKLELSDDEYYELERVIAWAQVLVTQRITEDGETEEASWLALVGIIALPPPDFIGPPGLADLDAMYVHESEITDANRAKWKERAREKGLHQYKEREARNAQQEPKEE